MVQSSPPIFGKRNLPRPPVVIAAAAPGQRVPSRSVPSPSVPAPARQGDDIPADQAAFFAAVRSELSVAAESDAVVVPWSFKAASLAGLAVGCALAGFNVTGQAGERFEVVAGLFGVEVETKHLLPAMIAMGLFAGARVATMIMLCVHAVLSRAGWTGHLAYVGGGALMSAVFAAAMLAVTGHPPAHGWLVELMAGAGGGLCYRAFAGAHSARRERRPASPLTPAPLP